MGERVLGLRALNRALLARQMLLRRRRITALEALERLVGLQAQAPAPPYVGLWTRLAAFRPEMLSEAIETRRAVRIALMRSTIHLVTASDCLTLRPALQRVLDREIQGVVGRALAGLELDEVVAAGRALVDEQPLTFAGVGARLRERWPERSAQALAHAVRARVPLVQVPPRGLWRRSGQAVHTSAEAWLGAPLAPPASAETIVLRYLGAFGPATVADAQAWSGLTRLAAAFEALRPRLRTFRDERGRELFDVPDAPRPRAEAEAPVRYLPEFDNVLLSHDERARIVAPAHHARVFRGGMIASTVLVDGFVRGAWRIEGRRTAVLRIELFDGVTRAARREIEEEGERLLAFAAPDADDRDVHVAVP